MQREKPGISLGEFEATLGVRPDHLSGGQIENFREGWALDIMSGQKRAHYFKRDGFEASKALCGARGKARWIYGAGNFPHCQACLKKFRRLPVDPYGSRCTRCGKRPEVFGSSLCSACHHETLGGRR